MMVHIREKWEGSLMTWDSPVAFPAAISESWKQLVVSDREQWISACLLVLSSLFLFHPVQGCAHMQCGSFHLSECCQNNPLKTPADMHSTPTPTPGF